MTPKYNWQLDTWPNFAYDKPSVEELVHNCIAQLNLLVGGREVFCGATNVELLIKSLVTEAVQTSAIEGENIAEQDLYSSITNYLGFNITKPKIVHDLRANGISQVLVDSYNFFGAPLFHKTLNHWHRMLFEYQSEERPMNIGRYRTNKEPMRVISGSYEKIKIHFEAPPSKQVPEEMARFIKWFNSTSPGQVGSISAFPVRSALAHLYFESIHPYEDGNGRIGRVIAEKALAQDLGTPTLICLSREIESNKKQYYSRLEEAQKSKDVTEWIKYFVETIISASIRSREEIKRIVIKARFYDRVEPLLNSRQKKLIQKMLKVEEFVGGIRASKYMSINKCSKATATRDLVELLKQGVLKKRPGAGSSSSYDLNI